jgi:hypothetical protein
MALSPKLIGPAIALITGLITSTSMSFVGLAMNYGFQPDFAMRWLRAAITSYVVVVPMLVIVVPRIQRFRRKPGPNCPRSLRIVPGLPIEP